MDPLATAIADAYTAAQATWPGCTLALARFSEELIRRLGPKFDPARLPVICTNDVYLAIACLDGDSTAISYLERDVFSEIDIAARKLRASPDQAAEVRGHLRRILFTAEPNRGAALVDYKGQGNLRGYIRVIASRELIRAVNRGRKEEPIEPLLEKLDISRAPEIALLKQRYGPDIAAALRASIEALDERPRAVLRYSLIAGWSVDKIGELYGVHRATAARWVNAAREELGEQLRREVATRLSIPAEEVDSIVRLVHSQIDVSLARIL